MSKKLCKKVKISVYENEYIPVYREKGRSLSSKKKRLNLWRRIVVIIVQRVIAVQALAMFELLGSIPRD